MIVSISKTGRQVSSFPNWAIMGNCSSSASGASGSSDGVVGGEETKREAMRRLAKPIRTKRTCEESHDQGGAASSGQQEAKRPKEHQKDDHTCKPAKRDEVAAKRANYLKLIPRLIEEYWKTHTEAPQTQCKPFPPLLWFSCPKKKKKRRRRRWWRRWRRRRRNRKNKKNKKYKKKKEEEEQEEQEQEQEEQEGCYNMPNLLLV